MQPPWGSHISTVHPIPSSHERAVPIQTPSEHVSLVVHELPSSQANPSTLIKKQEPSSQKSSVHRLPSSQLILAHASPK